MASTRETPPASAEQCYFFRHALIRDAAQLLLGNDEKARLHALALGILEKIVPESLRGAFAHELYLHAQGALGIKPELRTVRDKYLMQAASFEFSNFRTASALDLFSKLEQHVDLSRPQYAEVMLNFTAVLRRAGQLNRALKMLEASRRGLEKNTPTVQYGRLLLIVGNTQGLLGNDASAIASLEQAQQVFSQVGYR